MTLTVKIDSCSILLAAASARISFADLLAPDALGAHLDFVLVVECKNRSAGVLYLPWALLRLRESLIVYAL